MKRRCSFHLILGLAFTVACLNGCTIQTPSDEPKPLINGQVNDGSYRIEAYNASYSKVDRDGRHYILVQTGDSLSKPGVVIHATDKSDWDLSQTYEINAEVVNAGDEEIQVEMFVGNDPDGLTRWYCSDYVDLQPGQKDTIVVYLAWTPWAHKPQLDIVGMRGIPGKIKTDLNAIDQFKFYSRYATEPNQFLIGRIWSAAQLTYRDTLGSIPIVDVFGQYKHREWEDKVHNQTELVQADSLEILELSQYPSASDRDQYGGWQEGPSLSTTGYFRTHKINDKWWLVDPDGRLFWSNGLNCVITNFGLTGVEGRMDYFEALPPLDDSLAGFYQSGNWSSHGFYKDKVPFQAFNFYEANLYRKFGDNWEGKFRERIHDRMDSWGMNTLGNVSDLKAAQQQKTPYVGTVWINGTPKIEGSSGYWGKFHDVFDPQFKMAVRESMESQKTGAGDPWCIGFFVDNELSWGDPGSLAVGALKSGPNQMAKIILINDLKQKYIDIQSLNRAWNSDYSSWDDLLKRTKITSTTNQMAADFSDFYAKVAETYFQTISEELKRIAPNQLYLGCRFAWANNDITVRAAAKYCDVLSFNKYEYSVASFNLPDGVDKPVLIGEYHFGATDRGHVHPGVKISVNQKERGEHYKSYIQGALKNPFIVGAHWFQYTDQMITGREDGENYNVGFVDICDIPYKPLIQKVRETNYTMYPFRFESK